MISTGSEEDRTNLCHHHCTRIAGEAPRKEVANRKEMRREDWEKFRATCEVLLRYKPYGIHGAFCPQAVSVQEPHPHIAKPPFQWAGEKVRVLFVTCKRGQLHSASGTCFKITPLWVNTVQSREVSPSTSFSSAYPPSHCIRFMGEQRLSIAASG